VVVELEGPGANVATLPAGVVARRLTELLAGLGEMRPDACCVGAAGAELAAGRLRLERLVRRLLPGCPVRVVHDSRLVLAAAGVDSGIALIAGTGSVAYGLTADGREARRGGWGWMLGDEGSGVWIVREAAREVMRRAESGKPAGTLGEGLLAAARARDAAELSSHLHAMSEPMRWAALAPVVFEAAGSDGGARRILDDAAAALGGLVEGVQQALGMPGPVVLAGGLLLTQPSLETAVRKTLSVPCSLLEETPVAGAVRLARELVPD
jgi:N-acetylglucosamine kinase-like BadF-type ATPase